MTEEVRELVLSTIKREQAQKKTSQCRRGELRVYTTQIITVGSLLLALFHSPGS